MISPLTTCPGVESVSVPLYGESFMLVGTPCSSHSDKLTIKHNGAAIAIASQRPA